MRETRTVLYPWAYAGLAAILIPVALYLSAVWNWTSGAASLAVLAVPTCLAALTGQRSAAAVTVLIAACGCVLDGGAFFGGSGSQPEFGFTMLSVGVLLGMSGTVIGIVEPQHAELRRLDEQVGEYVLNLYRQQQRDESAATRNSSSELVPQQPPVATGEDGPVNYPMLLLTLQDVGRRISSHLDIDTLVPTIIATAKHLLKCAHCQLYLWNGQAGTLKSAGPLAPRRDQSYTPHPQRGVARWVLENRQIITRDDVLRDYTLRGLLDEEARVPDAIAPLTIGGELLGLVVLDGVEQDTRNFSRLLYILTDISALALKNAQLFRRIESMARRDGLTGLLNHASFQESLHATLSVAQAERRPLTVIMSDVDHFKKFNDTYGHQAGDHVLRETARLWQAVMPDYAIIARYGGEEFICILPDDDAPRASELAEILRAQLESFPLFFEAQELKVTASFGVAEFGRPATTPQELIRAADEAMYRAKKQGRNRVCASHALPAAPAAEPVLTSACDAQDPPAAPPAEPVG